MERLIYRNDLGQELEFSPFSPFILRSISESVKNDLVTVKQIARDGETYASSSLDVRDVKIKISILNRRESTEALKQRLISTLNPKKRGKLVYQNEKIEKELTVFLDEIPYPKVTHGTIDMDIDLVALNPYWTEKEKTEFLAFLTPRFRFPVVTPSTTGMVFGIRNSILETEVVNVGDVPTGFRVIFKAKGIVNNVEVENKLTGKKIKVLVNMKKGDTVEIINTPQRKMIYFNGTKAFKLLDRLNADFFALEVGKNLIGYNAELNAVNLDVILYYSPLYLGR